MNVFISVSFLNFVIVVLPLLYFNFVFKHTQFLMLKGPDDGETKVECPEHCDKFWFWLQQKNISSHRSAIVKAIAEKVNRLIPGIYEESDLKKEEDDE